MNAGIVIATRSDDARRSPRPLLEGGERLRQEVDRVTAGGEKYHPRTLAEARQVLLPQLQVLARSVDEIPASLRGTRVIFEATVLPNYLANSYYPAELFEEAGVVPVGTRMSVGTLVTRRREQAQHPTRTYFLAGDERSVSRLQSMLEDDPTRRGRRASAREAIRQFDVLRVPSAHEVIRTHELRGEPTRGTGASTWEAVLHPPVGAPGYESEDERALVWGRWIAWVEQLDGEVLVEYRRTVAGLTFVPIRLPADVVTSVAAFNPLRAIRPMPQIRPVPPFPFRMLPTGDPAPAPPPDDTPRTSLRVAVFDGGVDASVPALRPFVTAYDLTTQKATQDAVDHGTFVTGALLYGPLTAAATLETPAFGVDHYRVLPVPAPVPHDVDLVWILDRIVEVVRRRQYAIVNLSLGPALSVESDSEPHIWTSTLDELAAETGAVFISAVGNNGEEDPIAGLNLIQIPADMVNGLGIGACDCRAPVTPWARTVYSAVGPGRAGARVQPIGVCFGGDSGNHFHGIAAGGVFAASAGTSFATPTAARGLASLAARVGSRAALPNTLKAFAVHFAERADGASVTDVGYGRLQEDYDPLLESAPEEATILYEDEVERGSSITLPIPLPPGVADRRTVQVRWTIVFTSPVDPADPVDYTRRGLEVAFRPHARRFRLTNPRTRRAITLDVEKDADEFVRRLREGFVVGSYPVTKSPERFKRESALREEGKWETMTRSEIRMRRSGLHEPHVQLTYLSRERGALTPAADPLEFAMLVTLAAPRGVGLYDAVRQHYRVLQPVALELPLRVET